MTVNFTYGKISGAFYVSVGQQIAIQLGKQSPESVGLRIDKIIVEPMTNAMVPTMDCADRIEQNFQVSTYHWDKDNPITLKLRNYWSVGYK